MGNSITIRLDDETWKLFDEVHKETSINKTTQATRLLEHFAINKQTILQACNKELTAKIDEYLEEAERLSQLSDEVSNTLLQLNKHLPESKKIKVSKKSNKKARKPSNTLVFTEDSVNTISHKKRDEWYHDDSTSGFAIRTNNNGLVYYTRAKNPKVSSYTIRVKIGDTKKISLEDARVQHQKNLDVIFNQNINPNTLKPKAKWTRGNVATSENDDASKPHSNIDYSVYNGLRFDNGMSIAILNAILNSNPNVKTSTTDKYMNKVYSARGSQIYDAFKNDDKSIYELIREFRSLKTGKMLTSLGMISALCKAIYWHGTQSESKKLIARNKK
jgi:predicted transcriptional regulator